jgi:hypothetical protein
MEDLAFYTCYIGPSHTWSDVVGPLPSQTHPCYYFTNNDATADRAQRGGWTVVRMEVPMEADPHQTCQATKLLRCCPHLYPPLQAYAVLCYLDSKLWVTDLPLLLATKERLTETTPLALTRHPRDYTSVWGEFEEAMLQPRYAAQREQSASYLTEQLARGYKNVPLRHCCGFSLRRQGDLVCRIGERWYSHIARCGIEDQLSWQIVIQDFPDAVLELPYRACWDSR